MPASVAVCPSNEGKSAAMMTSEGVHAVNVETVWLYTLTCSVARWKVFTYYNYCFSCHKLSVFKPRALRSQMMSSECCCFDDDKFGQLLVIWSERFRCV